MGEKTHPTNNRLGAAHRARSERELCTSACSGRGVVTVMGSSWEFGSHSQRGRFFLRVNGSTWQQEPGQSTALLHSGFREALSGGEETGEGHPPLLSSGDSFPQTSKSSMRLPAAPSVQGSSCRAEFYMHQSTRFGY